MQNFAMSGLQKNSSLLNKCGKSKETSMKFRVGQLKYKFALRLLNMPLFSSSFCPSLKKRELIFPLLSVKNKQNLQTLQERAAKIGGLEELINEEKKYIELGEVVANRRCDKSTNICRL